MMFNVTQQYFNYIVAVGFIGGGNQRTDPEKTIVHSLKAITIDVVFFKCNTTSLSKRMMALHPTYLDI
jgi:hypothetical protein